MARRRPFAPEILRRRVDPALPGVEARLAAYRQEAFGTHIHETWSVGLVLAGATRVRLAGTTGLIQAGRIVCIGPGQPHACNPVPDSRFSYVMFHLTPPWARLAAGTARNPVFAAPLVANASLAWGLAGLYRILAKPASRLEKESLLGRVLAPLFLPDHTRGETRGTGGETGKAAPAREYLRAHFRDSVSLAHLAALCDLSPTQLLRRFKRLTGLPPHAYQNHLRVAEAKALLARDLPAALVAQEVGFADQSHLIRTFTPLVGATPAQYRRALLAG